MVFLFSLGVDLFLLFSVHLWDVPDVYCIHIFILIIDRVASFLTVSIHLWDEIEVRDLHIHLVHSLLRSLILLTQFKALALKFFTFFCGARLFIGWDPHVILLDILSIQLHFCIEVLYKLCPGDIWSLSALSKYLWSTFYHLLYGLLCLKWLFLKLLGLSLLIRVGCGNILSQFGSALFFLDHFHYRSFCWTYCGAVCTALILLKRVLLLLHDSWWIDLSFLGIRCRISILSLLQTIVWVPCVRLTILYNIWSIHRSWDRPIVVAQRLVVVVIVREVSDRVTLMASSCSSEKTVWNIFAVVGALDLLGLNWLLQVLNVYSQVHRLMMETWLSLDCLCGILDAQNRSLLNAIVFLVDFLLLLLYLWLILLVLSICILFWFSADVGILLVCRIGFCLIMTLAWWISLLLLLLNGLSLFCELLLVESCIKVLSHRRRELTTSSSLADFHLLRGSSISWLSSRFTFLGRTLICVDHKLLINFYWTMTNSRAMTKGSQCTVRRGTSSVRKQVIRCLFAWWCTLVERIMNWKLHILRRLICCWRWHFCSDVDCVHGLFQCINLLQVIAFWRLFRCGLALISSSIESLWVTLHDLWLEWRNFLLILDLCNVCWWRCHTSTNVDFWHFFFLLTKIIIDLILLNYLLKKMSIVALLFVVTKYLRHLVRIGCHNLPLIDAVFLLHHELLNTVWVYLELLMAEFVLSKVLVARNWVIVKSFVRCFQIAQKIVDVGLLDWWAILSLAFGREMIWSILSDGLLGSALDISEPLLLEVLLLGMMREVLSISTFDDQVQVSKVVKIALCKVLKFCGPNHSDAHVLSCICNDSTSQKIWVYSHEALLVETKVSEELSIFFEIFGKSMIRFVNQIVWWGPFQVTILVHW